METRGRKPTLTLKMIEEAKTLLPKCMSAETLAGMLGVSPRTLWYWLKRGKQEEKRLAQPGAKLDERKEIYLLFLQMYNIGIAKIEVDLIETVVSAAKDKNTSAAIWLLSKRFSRKWGDDKHEIRRLQKMVKALEAEVERAQGLGKRAALPAGRN